MVDRVSGALKKKYGLEGKRLSVWREGCKFRLLRCLFRAEGLGV